MRESGVPQFTVDSHRALRRLRPARRLVLHRAGLHQPAHRARPRGDAAARGRPVRGRPAGHRRRARGVQPGADRRLHRRRRDRRRRAGRADDHRHRHGLEGVGPAGRAARAAAAAGPHRWRLRAGVLRRVVPRRRPDPAGRPAGRAARRAVARLQAHRHGPRRVAVPEAAARAAGRVGARADVGRDLPGLHARLPVLPGGHDHATGARAVDHRHRRDGRTWPGGNGIRGGRPAVAVVGRPLRDRRHHQGAGRPLRGHPDRAVAAVDPRRRVQHRPRQRADPERAAVGSDVRARGRLRADPQGHQQDGDRGGPHRDGRARPTARAGGR